MKEYDLLIVGGGPAGASAAYWGAKQGMSVAVLEKKSFPRDKTCGDGLTPRAIRQLDEMEILPKLAHCQRHIGLRARANKKVLEIKWPSHPDYPSWGLCVRRSELDELVLNAARSQGAEIFLNTEAAAPVLKDDLVVGAKIGKSGDARKTAQDTEQVRARFTIVADGSNSRFGRALGTKRERSWPQGMAIRTYYKSPKHQDEWLESNLDIRNRKGDALPGYGWVFPLGDGTINVGIGILSTFKNYKNINTSRLMQEWAYAVDESWEIDPDNPCMAPLGGRLPMGGSVSPKAGQNWMAAGDAAGFVNPFNGEGIDYAYETGRKAAELAAAACSANAQKYKDGLEQQYSSWLQETYGPYFQVAKAFAKIIGNPAVMRTFVGAGMHSKTLMEWAFRIMANLLRPEERGPAELAYAAISKIANARVA